MSSCEHDTPAILVSDLEHVIESGVNPDCFDCPHDFDSCPRCAVIA